MTLLLALSSLAFATPALSIGGSCPGPATIQVTGATPGGTLAVIRGTGPGSFAIPSGTCAGVNTGLASPSLVTTGTADGAGSRTWSPTLPAGACSSWVAVVDMASCTVSAAQAITPASGSGWDITFNQSVTSSYSVMDLEAAGGGWMVAVGTSGGSALIGIDDTGSVTTARTLPLASIAGLTPAVGGGWMAAGELQYFDNPAVIKIAAGGSIDWIRAIDVGYPEQGYYAAAVSSTGDFLAAGIFDSLFTAAGVHQWTKIHAGGGGNVNAVVATSDGNWFIAGEGQYGMPAADYNLVVAKIDPSGNPMWNNAFGTDFYDWGADVAQTSDGGAIVAGWTRDAASVSSCMLVKLSSTGTLSWAKKYAGLSGASCEGVVQTSDGGFAATGARNNNLFLLKTNATGDVSFASEFGPGLGRALRQAADGGFMIVGTDGSTALRAVRTDAAGHTGCDTAVTVTGQTLTMATGANSTNGAQTVTVTNPTGALGTWGGTATDQCF